MTSHRSPIKWKTAAKIAGALAGAGPKMKGNETAEAVASMRAAAEASVEHVYNITRLEAAKDLRDSEVLIVDRAGWGKANAQSFDTILKPVAGSVMGQKLEAMNTREFAIAQYTGSAEMGVILAFLSSKVLGQYDPYAALHDGGPAGGRLMIVAPNLVAMERELNLDPEDFRLWVCLHEQTHRVQFAAAPWLKDYMLDQVRALTNEMGEVSDNLLNRLVVSSKETRAEEAAVTRAKKKTLAPHPATPNRAMDRMLSADGRKRLSQVTAVMSLLEGHANVVMDNVDRTIVPTVKTIRQRFERRSSVQKILTKIIYKALGMDAKKRQYRDGQKFVQFIVDARGMDAFNRIWTSPNTLPTESEIHNPQLWIDRVLGAEPQQGSGKAAEKSGE